MDWFASCAYRVFQFALSLCAGIIIGTEAAMPWFGFCALLIFVDVWSAVSLSKRVKKKYPESGAKGKFQSKYVRRVLWTFIIIFIALILANHIDQRLLGGGTVAESSVIWAFLIYELISIIENWSSENDNKFAKIAQRIVVNKAERHFGTEIGDLLNKDCDDSPPNESPKND